MTMIGDDLNQVSWIARKIALCDFRVMMVRYVTMDARTVLCIGQTEWSRCLLVKNPDADDPIIQLLQDDGRPLGHALLAKMPVARELPLSELLSDGYNSVELALDPDNHRYPRLDG